MSQPFLVGQSEWIRNVPVGTFRGNGGSVGRTESTDEIAREIGEVFL
jgi:hypothetical protein